MQAGQGVDARYLLADCGPFGYHRDATHGHADALAFELFADGQSWLVDPGVYSTHLGWHWRRFFRGTAAHNTVVVDEQDQSLLLDGRRVYQPAQATLQEWYSSPVLDFLDGAHDGYHRLPSPVTHRRQIVFIKPDYWVVIDWLTGAGEHCVDLYFHLLSDLKTSLDPRSGQLHAASEAGARLQILPLDHDGWQAALSSGATDPVQGWVSRYSGEKRPAPTLRYRRQSALPVTFCTVLYPQPAGRTLTSVTVTPLAVRIKNEGRSAITALTIDHGRFVDDLLVAARATRDNQRIQKQFAGYTTDAHLFYRRQDKISGQVVSQMALGGQRGGA